MTLLKSRDHHIKDMAASTAYLSFFSPFPLLLGVIAGGSFFLDSEEIRSHLDRIITDTLPGSAAFVTGNIDALIRLRGAAGVASIAGLFWSAGKMFGALSRGINRALGLTRTHPFFLTSLRSFLMAGTHQRWIHLASERKSNSQSKDKVSVNRIFHTLEKIEIDDGR